MGTSSGKATSPLTCTCFFFLKAASFTSSYINWSPYFFHFNIYIINWITLCLDTFSGIIKFIFVLKVCYWYNMQFVVTIMNCHYFVSFQYAVDIFGLSGLDRLFCFMIVQELQMFLRYLTRFFIFSHSLFRWMYCLLQPLTNLLWFFVSV